MKTLPIHLEMRSIAIVVLITLAAFVAFALCGCSTMQQSITPQRLAPKIKIAAYVGTAESLREHPEWRDGFRLAADDLDIIARADRIDFETVMQIVQRLPVKELRSERAQIYITTGGMMLEDAFNSVDLSAVGPQIRAVVEALRDGIRKGLEQRTN